MSAHVVIRITGNRTERLLERMRSNRIAIYALGRISNDTVELTIRASDFLRLHLIARNSGCHIRIIKKIGSVFVLKRAFRRRTLWISSLFLLMLLFAASTRILYISVEGCTRIAEQTILRALAEHGIKIGASRNGWDFPTLNNMIRLYDDRIAWVGLSLDGVVLRAKIVESIPTTDDEDPNAPADVIAQKDGVITRIEATSGRACVAVGDRITAGDLLICGDLTREDSQYPVFVHASGRVFAEVAYIAEAIAGPEDTVLSDSGNTVAFRQIRIGNRILFTSDIPYKDYEIRSLSETLITDSFLPIRVAEGVCYELTEQPAVRTTEEMAEAAMIEAEQLAMLKIPKDAAIIDKHAIWSRSESHVVGIVTILTEESIGMIKEIDFDRNYGYQFDRNTGTAEE